MKAKDDLGKAGEEIARRHLKRNGLRILARNYTCPTGEIDLIAAEEDCIAFVEVKTRADDASADPEANVTPTKQRHLERAARSWLAKHCWPDCAYRFDVITVIMPEGGEPRVRHIREAFLPSR